MLATTNAVSQDQIITINPSRDDWDRLKLDDVLTDAEMEFRNEHQDGEDSSAGDWFATGEANGLKIIFSGTHANDHSPGASHYTSATLYPANSEAMAEYDRDLHRWESMPEYEDDSDPADDGEDDSPTDPPIQVTVEGPDVFTRAYLECALWSSIDDDGMSLDESYGPEDVSGATLAEMARDCAQFQADHGELIAGNLVRAGHDFWLTRNRHGAGFWDGDWPQVDAKTLTDASHQMGSYDLYVGDDGQAHGA